MRKEEKQAAIEQRVGIIKPLTEDRKSNSWRQVDFKPPFCTKCIVVIPMAQTHRGPDTPGLRIRKVTPAGFEIRYDEVFYSRDLNDVPGPFGSNGNHPQSEDVGWVAYGF